MKILISSTEYAVFIDTDIICLEEWLLNIHNQFPLPPFEKLSKKPKFKNKYSGFKI